MKLKKSIFKKTDQIFISEKWICDGHFCAVKSLFEDSVLISTYESFTAWYGKIKRQGNGCIDEKMNTILPVEGTPLTEWEKTEWRWKHAQAFKSEADDFLFIDEDYVKLLELDKVYAERPNTACYDAPTVDNIQKVVMPIQLNDNEMPYRKTKEG
jgi:hypothetical protein